MRRSTEIKLRQLGTIAVAWIAFGIAMAMYDHLVLMTRHGQGLSADYSLGLAIAMNVVSAAIGAVLGGSYLVFYIHPKYHDKPYGYTLAAVAVSFVLVIMIIVVVIGVSSIYMSTGRFIGDAESLRAFVVFLADTTRAKNIVTWAVVVSFTQFLLQINSKFGQRGLANLLRGKYNTPKTERRTFMFLDLNASTTLAEKLGDEKYHQLLRDFFADVTEPIINNHGEIYQYVGDEVVVTWNYADSLSNNNCVRCFFDIKASIQRNADRYLKRYGLVPEFKAGLHSGHVVAGEVGILKREITYSGDVLNTTSRILGLCKEVGAELIASASVLRELSTGTNYLLHDIGMIRLRGKENEIALHQVCMASPAAYLSPCAKMSALRRLDVYLRQAG